MTYYFDHGKQVWIEGPLLIRGRHSHTSGSVVDEYTMETLFITVGGQARGYELSDSKSTEVLWENQWLQGMYQQSSHTLEINTWAGH